MTEEKNNTKDQTELEKAFEEYRKKHGIEKKSWEEFRNTGLLWWVNRILHLFGWAIVVDADKDEKGNLKILDVYPARVKFRGFSRESEERNFKKLTKYLAKESETLLKEVEE